jgi:predicted porin
MPQETTEAKELEQTLKKHIIAAALGLTAVAAANAQSSVTIYGFVDQAFGKQIGTPAKQVYDTHGSRLGFTGSEDLGNGLTASFGLEHRFSPDTGVGASRFWQAGSYVALGSSTFGKVILGRWWTQSFLKSQLPAEVFGMGTVGITFGSVGCAASCIGTFWMNNSVTYEYANGPFAFGVQTAPTEGLTEKKPLNVGASYSAGGLYLGYGYEDPGNVNDVWHHLTANYDFKVVKLLSGFGTGKNVADQKVKNILVGVDVPVGAQGHLLGLYDQHKIDSTVVTSKAALGYQHHLSKRTKVYTTVANDSKAATSKSAYEVGLLHSW